MIKFVRTPFMMNNTTKLFALFAYLLSFIGALLVLFLRRKDDFARYHARQSLGIALLALALFAAWGVVGWVMAWIPAVGFLFAVALFSLVIAGCFMLIISSISGMVYAVQGKMQPPLFIGEIALKLSALVFEPRE